MRIYLAGLVGPLSYVEDIVREMHPCVLESYYYINDKYAELIPTFTDFLLDSGAYTFTQKAKDEIDWKAYVERYAAFINKYDIKKFFELDIDSIVGYDRVLELRNYLEYLTQKRSIPVWHLSRGKEEYIKMCKEYDYVALGGIAGASAQLYLKYKDMYPWFIKTAHKYKTKVHGLGITGTTVLPHNNFDSVDSTAWLAGNKYGYVCKFDGKKVKKVKIPKGKMIANAKTLSRNNLTEWIKYQRYAEVHL